MEHKPGSAGSRGRPAGYALEAWRARGSADTLSLNLLLNFRPSAPRGNKRLLSFVALCSRSPGKPIHTFIHSTQFLRPLSSNFPPLTKTQILKAVRDFVITLAPKRIKFLAGVRPHAGPWGPKMNQQGGTPGGGGGEAAVKQSSRQSDHAMAPGPDSMGDPRQNGEGAGSEGKGSGEACSRKNSMSKGPEAGEASRRRGAGPGRTWRATWRACVSSTTASGGRR